MVTDILALALAPSMVGITSAPLGCPVYRFSSITV
jgi:hypothetical protein